MQGGVRYPASFTRLSHIVTRLSLLGTASLERDRKRVGGRAGQRHRLALLAAIGTKPAGLSRDRLIALLWPETDAEKARHLLSHSIYLLRQALGEDAIVLEGDAVRLHPPAVECDVLLFDDAIRRGDHAAAVALYAGPFLDGFFLANSVEFERWVDGERDRLGRAYAAALESLATERETAGDLSAAVRWWQRLAQYDPHNSRIVLRLVRAIAAGGDVAGALRIARAHEALLREALGIALPAELAKELERLRAMHAQSAAAPVVTAAALPPIPTPSRRTWYTARRPILWAAGALGLLAAGWALTPRHHPRPVVAVLPFQSLARDTAQAYFADALTDMIITDLARLRGLGVISRSSVDLYHTLRKPLPEIAQELRAAYIVEGSVVRAGSRTRITVQLIEASTDRHLWAESYERDVADILALQAEVARGVARQIGVVLQPLDSTRARPRIANVSAYEAYLKGVYYSRTVGLQQGQEWLEQAIALDSSIAPAYAELARNLYFQAFFSVLEPSVAFRRMRAAAQRALALDSTLADAHGTLALVLMHQDQNWVEAERQFRLALEYDPNNAQVRHDYAHFLLAVRRLPEAAEESQRAVALDPVNPGLESCLGWHELSGRQYDSAVAQSLRAVAAAPEFFWGHQTLGWSYEQVGRYPEAIASLRRATELSGGLPFTQASLGHALAIAGERAAAQQLLARLTAARAHAYVSPYDLAAVYAGLGDDERAMQLLQQAFADRSAQIIHVGWDPRFAKLHRDPRFVQLLRDLKLTEWIAG